jgi:hypothetical protein
MGILDFFKKKSEDQNSRQNASGQSTQRSSNLFSKNELENLIRTLSSISYLFRDSQLLRSTGGGRNEAMMSKVHSYAGILGYFYEIEYNYGRMSDIVDNRIASHFLLVKNAMNNYEHRKRTVRDLANNWSDVLQVIFNMQLVPNPDGDKFKQIDSDIRKVTSAIEKLSGGKCRAPKDPRY